MIPFVDIAAQYRSLKVDIDKAVVAVIESSALIRGPEVEKFEKRFADLHGVDHCLGVGSGTDALALAVRALEIGPGDEIITVDNTWISTAFSATYVGADVVLIDVDPATYQLDPVKLEAAITPKTKAVIPVHMFGHPAPMTEIMEICRRHKLKVIEDVAQAPLAEVDGRRVGTFGDIACFSFYPSKNLGCYGDGGAIITNSGKLFQKIRRLADYGQEERYHHIDIGFNSRLDSLQAAVLNVKLDHLEAWTEKRRQIASNYTDQLAKLGVRTPVEANWARAVYHLYVIEVDNRDECLAYLRDNGVMAQVHYPAVIHRQPCYEKLGYESSDFPVSTSASERMLSLPIFPEMTDEQVDIVTSTLADFLELQR